MATEYKLPYTASEINERLEKVDMIETLQASVDEKVDTSTVEELETTVEELETTVEELETTVETVSKNVNLNSGNIKNLQDSINTKADVSDIPTIPDSLKNPNALIINGQDYDGSVSVDMTDIISALIDEKLGVIENAYY